MNKKDPLNHELTSSEMDRMLKGDGRLEDREMRKEVLKLFGDEKAHFVDAENLNDRLDALRRLLPAPLAKEPIVIAGYLEKMLLNPGHDGFVLVEAWKLRFEGKK